MAADIKIVESMANGCTVLGHLNIISGLSSLKCHSIVIAYSYLS